MFLLPGFEPLHPNMISQTVRCAPPLRPSVASHSIRYLYCHFATSGALRASHQRIIASISALRDQEEHCSASLLRPFPKLYNRLQEFHHFFPRLFRHVQWNFWLKTITTNTCSCFVYVFAAFARSLSWSVGKSSSKFFNSSSRLILHFAHLLHPSFSSHKANRTISLHTIFQSRMEPRFFAVGSQ